MEIESLKVSHADEKSLGSMKKEILINANLFKQVAVAQPS